MSPRPAHFLPLICLCSLLAPPALSGCASAPVPAPRTDKIEFIPKRTAPERPEYHAESDAVLLKTPESRALVQASCAEVENPATCREQADRRLLGYRGAFSARDVEEILVGVGSSAVLLTRENGAWSVVARAPATDIDHCLIRNISGLNSPDELVCRGSVATDWGHRLVFFRLGWSRSEAQVSQLEVNILEAPRATDIDAALFAGWKHDEKRIELRFHNESKVYGASQVNFGGPNACRYRTFGLPRAPESKLIELDGCYMGSKDAPQEESRSNYSTYDGRLEQPIRSRNRAFAMCYQTELDRLIALSQANDVQPEKAEDVVEVEKAEQEEPQELTAGDVHTRFVIGSSGAPVSCQVAKSTLQNQNVEQCLCRQIMDTAFPPVPEGKFVDVTYPFSFTPPAR